MSTAIVVTSGADSSWLNRVADEQRRHADANRAEVLRAERAAAS